MNWNSSFPLILELSSTARGRVHFSELINTLDPQKLEDMMRECSINSVIECYLSRKPGANRMKNNEDEESPKVIRNNSYSDKQTDELYTLSLYPRIIRDKDDEYDEYEESSPPITGDIRICRYITRIAGKGIICEIGSMASDSLETTYSGFIHITEISDHYLSNILSVLKRKGVFVGRVLSVDDTNIRRYGLSTRDQMVSESGWEAMSSASSTLSFMHKYAHLESRGDIRNRVFKYGVDWLKEGTLGIGYITNISSKGCFITSAPNLTVRAAVSELEGNVDNSKTQNIVSREYPQNSLCIYRIINITKNKGKEGLLYHVSERESIIKYKLEIKLSDIKVGKEFTGVVEKSLRVASPTSPTLEYKKTLLQIVGSKHRAYVKEEIHPHGAGGFALDVGGRVAIKITKTNLSISPLKIRCVPVGVSPLTAGELEEKDMLINLYNSVRAIRAEEEPLQELHNKKGEITKEGLNWGGEFDVKHPKHTEHTEHNEDPDPKYSVEGMITKSIEYSDSEGEDMEDIDLQLDLIQGGKDNQVAEDLLDPSDQSDQSDNNEQISSNINIPPTKPPKSGAKKLKERIKEEKAIRKLEAKLVGGERSMEGFERMIINDMNNSYLWMEFVGFAMEEFGIHSARRVITRAVNQFAYSQLPIHKFNIWIAYINLENAYGEEDTLQK